MPFRYAVIVSGPKKICIIAILGLMVIAIPSGIWFGRPAYHRYKEKRAVNQAQVFINKGDLRSAILSLRLAIALNSSNVTSTRMMADVFDQGHSPAALAWRRRVSELEPNLENKIILAACALRYEKPPFLIADSTLQSIAAQGETNTGYHLVASQLALKLNRLADAEAHLKAAARLDPTNHLHQLNLATVRLQSADTNIAEGARRDLASLTSEPTLGLPALRSLTADSITRHQLPEAEDYSRRLAAHAEATLEDRLLHLTALSESKSVDFSNALARVEQECGTNSIKLAQTVSWMNAHGLARDALSWMASLPDSIRNAPPASLAEADCYMTLGDWPGLQARLVGHRWEEQEFLRLAMLTRSLREQGQNEMAGRNWRLSLSAASARPEFLLVLLQLARAWAWDDETKELLWVIVGKLPSEEWPLENLRRIYMIKQDSEGLYRVYQALLEKHPHSAELKNNVATLGLLLGHNRARSAELAREVYEVGKTNATLVSTYAFSLYNEGKTTEALALMQALPEADLQNPEVALYYGLLLASAGDVGKAEAYFVAAEKGHPLPQERALLAKARQRR